jgi:hypothetical protein
MLPHADKPCRIIYSFLLYLEGKVQLRHFYKKHIAHPLFQDPTNGAAFVPDSETNLAASGE